MNTGISRSVRLWPGLVAAMALAMLTAPARANVQEYYTADRQDWFDDASAAGNVTTIGFDDLGENVLVTEQYAGLGVHFTGNPNFTRGEDFVGFPQDGWGLDGNEEIHLLFDEPQIGIGFDFPGLAEVDLYADGVLVHDSNHFGVGGAGNFGGVLGVEFDEAIIVDWLDGQVTLDDLHFVSVPAPACAPLLLTGFIAFRSRRRTPRLALTTAPDRFAEAKHAARRDSGAGLPWQVRF